MAAGDSTDTNDERYANVLAMVQAGVASGPCWCVDDRQSPPPWPPTPSPPPPADGSITWLMESTLPHDEGDDLDNWSSDQAGGVTSINAAKQRCESIPSCVAFSYIDNEPSGWYFAKTNVCSQASSWRSYSGGYVWYYISERTQYCPPSPPPKPPPSPPPPSEPTPSGRDACTAACNAEGLCCNNDEGGCQVATCSMGCHVAVNTPTQEACEAACTAMEGGCYSTFAGVSFNKCVGDSSCGCTGGNWGYSAVTGSSDCATSACPAGCRIASSMGMFPAPEP